MPTPDDRRPFTDFQLAEIAVDVGFPIPSGAATAVAVALAESGGKWWITNTAGNHPPSRDRGLWQINDYWHPEVTDRLAFDPIQNATAALRISNGGKDWHPWTTYTSGAYLQFLHRAEIAVRAVVPGAFTLHRFLGLKNPMMYGVDVAALQHHCHLLVDGVFGPLTSAAVIDLQRMNHLPADGIVGPQVCRVLGWSWVAV